MSSFHHLRFRPAVAPLLFVALLAILWLAGGASRADVSGQVVVRAVSWGLLIAALILAPRPSFRTARPVWLVLLAAIIVASVQLVPLPPGVWQALPGRSILAEPARLAGSAQPWRPWSMVPGATLNALMSLIVPLVTLVLVGAMTDKQRQRLPVMMLSFIAAATFVGLLQFSGALVTNPFVNDTPGEVGGIFANRNHFALLIAMGCALAPVWALRDESALRWRGPLAGMFVLLFLLTTLATGSRAGVALAAIALILGIAAVAKRLRRVLRRRGRWAFLALIAASASAAALLVFAAVFTGRSVSIGRVMATDLGQDMRGRGLPTVLAMVREYFPFGAGLGGFDPLFRMHEPFALLKPTYFNHAHNDWLEILLDTGIIGVAVLAMTMWWWGVASVRAWRAPAALPRLGSIMLLLVFVASGFDYPARTPIIMAFAIVAGVWLSGSGGGDAPALPRESEHL